MCGTKLYHVRPHGRSLWFPSPEQTKTNASTFASSAYRWCTGVHSVLEHVPTGRTKFNYYRCHVPVQWQLNRAVWWGVVRVFHRKIQQRIHFTHTHPHAYKHFQSEAMKTFHVGERAVWGKMQYDNMAQHSPYGGRPSAAAGWIVPIAKSTTFFVSGNLWLLDWQTVRICTAQRWPEACENSLLEGIWLNQGSAVWEGIYFGDRIDCSSLFESHFEEVTYRVLKDLPIVVVTITFWL